MAGMQALGKLDWDVAELLLDELMTCISFIPDPTRKERTRPLHETDIEEVATRVKLKAEVFTLHTGFSFAAARLNTTSNPSPKPVASEENTSNTKMSPAPSVRSRAPALPASRN